MADVIYVFQRSKDLTIVSFSGTSLIHKRREGKNHRLKQKDEKREMRATGRKGQRSGQWLELSGAKHSVTSIYTQTPPHQLQQLIIKCCNDVL